MSIIKSIKLEHDNDIDDVYHSYKAVGKRKTNKNNQIICQNKCFDVVDKWIAKVAAKVPSENYNWNSFIQREIALLKVRYGFLPERQLRGKVLVKFGIPSSMGNIVRYSPILISIYIFNYSSINKIFI